MDLVRRHTMARAAAVCAAGLVVLAAAPSAGWAQWDSLSGPVARDARRALDEGEVMPALKWVAREHEDALRTAFEAAGAGQARTPIERARRVAVH